MIALYIYGAGLVAVLAWHGVYGNWQDDELAIVHAIGWPLFLVILGLPLLVIMAARAASAMSTGTVKTPKAVEGRSPASATREAGDAHTQSGNTNGI